MAMNLQETGKKKTMAMKKVDVSVKKSDMRFTKGRYSCRFYGRKSFSLYKDGIEVMHTYSFDDAKTKESFEECIRLYEMLVKDLPKDNKYYEIN